MSLLKRKQLIKNKFKDIEKISSAHARIESRDKFYSDLTLDINGVFKIITIEYTGNIYDLSLLQKGFNFNHSSNKNKIIINNPLKLNLKDNALLTFKGKLNKFKFVKVFGWGGLILKAETENPSHIKANINNDKNIIGTSDVRFEKSHQGGRI